MCLYYFFAFYDGLVFKIGHFLHHNIKLTDKNGIRRTRGA